MKHTPTPWTASFGEVYADGFKIFIGMTNKAHAEHIVKCVNAHDELMEFVEGLTDERISDYWREKAKELIEKYGDE